MPVSAIERSVNAARSRLFRQAFLNRFVFLLSVALGAGLSWLLVQPFVLQSPPEYLRWVILGTLVVVGTIASIVWAVRATPSRETAALEIDSRFNLRERVITAVGLDEDLRTTPAGKALLKDAEEKVKPLSVAEKFPVRPTRSAFWIPGLVVALVLVLWLYNPDVSAKDPDEGAGGGQSKAGTLDAAKVNQKKENPFAKPTPGKEEQKKSQMLKELEDELEQIGKKYAKDEHADTPEKAREKLTDLQPIEEKLAKLAEEQKEQLENIKQKLEQLEKNKAEENPESADGPAKNLQDALAKGDLEKAKDEVDELKKKAKDKKLDKQDQEKLDRQLTQMKNDLERLTRKKEQEELEKKKDELKKEREQAKMDMKKEDAERLDRELEKVEKQQKDIEKGQKPGDQDLNKLAEKIGSAQQAVEKGDLEGAAEKLEGVKQDIQNIENKDEELRSTESTLQKVKEEKQAAADEVAKGEGQKGQGQGQAQKGQGQGGQKNGGQGDGQGGKGGGDPGKSGPNQGGIGAGEREINQNAKTGTGDEERVRGVFNQKGQKNYGGLVKGDAFKKKSDVEMGQEIKQAVQEAPGASSRQGVLREDRDSVKEYFERLGNTGGK